MNRLIAIVGPTATGKTDLAVRLAERLRGEVVSAAAFAPQDTDFRTPLLQIKKARPEVVFIHASVDQMILLGPQLDFYRVGALVLGTSNWNSPKLLRKAGVVMERAIFPSDAVLFPPHWRESFAADWRPEHLPSETTPLALKAYQATMMVLETLARDDIQRRQRLAEALQERLANQQVQVAGPAAFARTVRMFREGEVVSFPGERFAETWTDLPLEITPADSLEFQEFE